MRYNIQDYVGKRLNSVVVLDKDDSNKHPNANMWRFRCDCGKEFIDHPSRIIKGHRKSCGCRKVEAATIHGVNQDPFYPTWFGMMRRCYHKENHNYERYGGRGITVCEEWHNPVTFVQWARSTVGTKTSELSLDRIDNNKGYSPSNCRWVTPTEQSNNRAVTKKVYFNGELTPVTELARSHGLSPNMVRARIFDLGWSVEDAVSIPRNGSRKKKHPYASLTTPKKLICINGEQKTITEWCRFYGTSRDLAYHRISRGWDVESAVKTPKKASWERGRKKQT